MQIKQCMLLLGLSVALCSCATKPVEPSPEATPAVAVSEPAPVAPEPEPAPMPEPEPAVEVAPPPEPPAAQWAVALQSERTQDLAQQDVAALGKKGYTVEIRTVEVKGATWYRVVLPGFATAGAAKRKVPALEQELGLSGLWVVKPD